MFQINDVPSTKPVKAPTNTSVQFLKPLAMVINVTNRARVISLSAQVCTILKIKYPLR